MSSILSQPADPSEAEAQAYSNALIALTEGQDPLTVLGATGTKMRTLASEVPLGRLEVREGPGKWSVAQVLKHMLEAEIIWGYRIRMAIASPGCTVPAWDQDAWGDRLPASAADVDCWITAFTALRTAHLRLLTQPFDGTSKGWIAHAERGDEPIAHMIRLQAGHDLAHLQQIVRITEVIEGDSDRGNGVAGDG